jgi:cellulose synthase/poly-beta-1,6-N-acetylglucosamine synthase-like glycosyltransferase
MLNFEYVAGHFRRFPVRGISPIISLLNRLLPGGLKRRVVKLNPSGMIVMARRTKLCPGRKLSIIVPVFNEHSTFRELIQALLNKDVCGLEKEVVIVESNSSDGSREDVLSYQDTPGVKVILEERPRGKGHAVRAGLQQASGDFIIIQDADLEYDIQDYDALVKPLMSGSQAFVLGSPPVDRPLKMRVFTGNPYLPSS